MDNILLVFLNNLKDIEGFNKIIDEFDKRDYKMYLYDNIKETDFDFSELPDIIEFYKNQHMNVNKIVVLSNLRDLIFAWYRCYNSLIDDFIYFIDEEESNYFDFEDKHYNFYFNLWNFKNIENETINGKIYINNIANKKIDLNFCSKFEDFDFINKLNKKPIRKTYVYRKYQYTFDYKNTYVRDENICFSDSLGRIVMFKGQSQYDVLRVLIDYMAEAFESMGYNVDIIDLLNPNFAEEINRKIIHNKCDFVFSNNCIAIDLKINNENLYDKLGIPFIGVLGDHPVNQLSRIINSPKKALFVCIDKENVQYMNKYFPHKNAIFASYHAYKTKNYIEKKYNDREIDVLFSGSLINPSQIKDSWNDFGKEIREILNQTVDMALKNNDTIEKNLNEILKSHFIGNITIEERATLHSLVERYIRMYKRYNLVKEIGKTNLKVVCFGNSEEYEKLNVNKKLQIHPNCTFQELLDLMNNSKIVLNMTGHLHEGVTERILSSMINGAAVVTESNNYIRQNFNDGEDIILYSCNQLDSVAGKINYFLKNQHVLECIAKRGQDKAKKRFDFKIMLTKTIEAINNTY
ncbi:glycosyltransferase family protein [Brassicibacter mesophilus]|uniref:glycosyltransferase n=1 Tax=Brassicibacter mesophilus TaxID=745119 RepID=UPI003D1DC223